MSPGALYFDICFPGHGSLKSYCRPAALVVASCTIAVRAHALTDSGGYCGGQMIFEHVPSGVGSRVGAGPRWIRIESCPQALEV